MNLRPAFFLFSCLVALMLPACQNDAGSGTGNTATPAASAAPSVPAFNRDSAYAFIARQLEFGPRTPGSPGHEACREWLVAKLRAYGAEVIEQPFQARVYTGATLNGTNITARFNPKRGKRILLGAHWDTRHIADSPLSQTGQDQPIMGADDGASGVGVLLEVARNLALTPIDMGVDIVFFDLEDYGEANGSSETWALGAQHWSRNLPFPGGQRPQYGILLDMVGAQGARFTKEEVSRRFAPNVVDKVWRLAANMGYANYFLDVNTPGVTDDHYFVNTIAGIPMIDIINKPAGSQTGFVAHWHTQEDTLDKIDKGTLRAVGQVVLAVLYRENAGTL